MRQAARFDARAEAFRERERGLKALPDAWLDTTALTGQLLRNPQPDPLQIAAPRQLDRLRERERGGVAAILTDHVPEQEGGVGDVAGERPRLVERRGERD